MALNKSGSKVTVLLSKIENDCFQNLQNLIVAGKMAARFWDVEWNAICWDVTSVFAVRKRSHRNDRKRLNFWFSEYSKSRDQKVPFVSPFGEIIRSLVVLRHKANNQCFNDQQQIIIAARFIYKQLKNRDYDLITLTPGDCERACEEIKQILPSASTAYKVQRFVIEIAATLDANRICSRRLNFKYAGLSRPSTVNGIDHVRLDDQDLQAGASRKLIAKEVISAIGRLYQAIPDNETVDRLLICVVTLAACTGRRIGEILTLPKQEIKYDRNGYAYLLYYGEKRSQGSQIITLAKLYLIPQTVPLVARIIAECEKLTDEPRRAARYISETGNPYFEKLPQQEVIGTSQIEEMLGLAKDCGNQWTKTRNISYYKSKGKYKEFRIADIIEAARKDLFQGPAIHVTPPAKDLELPELLFIVFKNSNHHRKATLKYAVYPIDVQQVGDFLGARGLGAFRRYFRGTDDEKHKVNTHRFRHTLNTLLQRGGMSDVLQTEWFGRKKESDTKAYQHMTPAERAWATYQLTGGRHTGDYAPLHYANREEAAEIINQNPVIDVGPGWCQHDWRNQPCPRGNPPIFSNGQK